MFVIGTDIANVRTVVRDASETGNNDHQRQGRMKKGIELEKVSRIEEISTVSTARAHGIIQKRKIDEFRKGGECHEYGADLEIFNDTGSSLVDVKGFYDNYVSLSGHSMTM